MYRQPFKSEWPITQSYGEKITSVFHTGIDYGCPIGTSILASDEGTVMFAAWDSTGYGNAVIIKHKNGNATLYAHLSDVSVKVGDQVRQGELIGHSGSTGHSTGPHLHFESRTQWNDPKTHFDPMNLPLMSVDDSISDESQKPNENGLIDGKNMEVGSAEIICEYGAYGHNDSFTNKWVFPKGTKVEITGNVKTRGDLEFCECKINFWIAAHDGITQILKN